LTKDQVIGRRIDPQDERWVACETAWQPNAQANIPGKLQTKFRATLQIGFRHLKEFIKCLASVIWLQSLNAESLLECADILQETHRFYPSVCSVKRDLTKDQVIGRRIDPQD